MLNYNVNLEGKTVLVYSFHLSATGPSGIFEFNTLAIFSKFK